MRDIGPAHHAAEDRAQPRVVEHLLGEDDEGVMHIVLWYGSGDAVEVSYFLRIIVLWQSAANRPHDGKLRVTTHCQLTNLLETTGVSNLRRCKSVRAATSRRDLTHRASDVVLPQLVGDIASREA